MITIIIISFALLLVEAFFSGSEIVIVSSNKFTLRIKALQGDQRAKQTLALIAEPERLVTTTLICTTLAIVGNTTLLTLYVSKTYGIEYVYMVSLILTPITLIFGEYLPKSMAKAFCDDLVRIVSPIIFVFSIAFSPITAFMRLYQKAISKVLRLPLYERKATSKQELGMLMRSDFSNVQISKSEKSMITNLIKLAETQAGDIVKPLIDVQCVNANQPISECFHFLEELGYTKFPVYEDRVDNIVGQIDLYSIIEIKKFDQPIRNFFKQALYIPEVMRLDRVIELMKKNNQDMVIIVDEYGAAEGILTLEDVLEQVTGDIEDEYDEVSFSPKKIAANAYIINGRSQITQVNQALNIELPEGEYDTIAGLIIQHFGRIPKQWETLKIKSAFMTITKTSVRAVEEIYLEIVS